MKEIYKGIAGFIGAYSVSNLGNVRNDRTGRLLKRDKSHKYSRVSLSLNGKVNRAFVHRLVCFEFIANPEEKPHVNHIDSDVQNNDISNLEWCTPKENAIHANLFGDGKSSRLKATVAAAKKANATTELKLRFLLGDRFIRIYRKSSKKMVEFKCICGNKFHRRSGSVMIERGGICSDCKG